MEAMLPLARPAMPLWPPVALSPSCVEAPLQQQLLAARVMWAVAAVAVSQQQVVIFLVVIMVAAGMLCCSQAESKASTAFSEVTYKLQTE